MMGLLSGIRVVSLAQQYPGPYCTMLLADLGADVILVERPHRGDPARVLESFFGALNRGKRSVTLDLKQERGREICWELLETADVLVEGFRPGVMERLGLDPERVLGRLPELVYCSISGYGQDGPYRTRAGHDLSYQALAGLLAGWLDDEPEAYRSPLAIGDLSSAMFAAFGIVAALLQRERGGGGQYVDVSMTDGLVSWMGTALEPILNGRSAGGIGGEPAYGVFRCGDGRALTLSIAHEDHFWRNLCEAIGRPDLAELDALARRARREELRKLIAEQLQSRPRDQWVEVLERADVPVGPALSLQEVSDDPHLRARGLFVASEARAGERRWHVAHPLKLSRAPVRPPSPAPALGQHTEEVLRELGHDAPEIERLRQSRTI
jgi:crotonobetainyl-CoA:carnitine CoA-transferase CaiB-like acyl-CoA transferase